MMLRAARLLMRLRVRRLVNMLSSGFRRRRAVGAGGKRQATATRSRGAFLSTIAATLMLVWATTFSFTALQNIRRATENAAAGAPDADLTRVGEQRPGEYVAHVHAYPRSVAMDATSRRLPPESGAQLTLVFSLMMLATLLTSLGTRELSQPEWDMEWLVTLPLPRPTLIGVRLLERTFVNPTAVLFLWPFLAMLAWHQGVPALAAILVGAGLALPLLLVIGALRTLLDTGLHLLLGPAQLRNVQALITITGMLCFYVALSAGTAPDAFVYGWSAKLPGLTRLLGALPAGLAAHVLMSQGGAAAGTAIGLLAETALAVGGTFALLSFWLRHGVARSGVRESGRAQAGAAQAAARTEGAAVPAVRERRLLSPVQARELKLLGRDRNFLVQTMVMPVVILAAQFFFNTRLLSSVSANPAHLGAVAFGLSAYALMFSAFQTLNAEGRALWIMYTVPHTLEGVLRQKARLWAVLTLVYPLLLLGIGFSVSGLFSAQALLIGVIVLVGVPIYATIATCLGVFGCDPLAEDVRRRVRPTFAYLYFMLTSIYTYAIYASDMWQRLALMTLSALLALALWQKVRDRLPCLLDPTALPPARVSLSDGLIAVMVFFVLQGLLTLMFLNALHDAPGFVLVVAYAAAGALTVAVMLFVFWRSGAQGVPRVLGGGAKALLPGVLLGLLAGGVGLGWMAFIRAHGLFTEELRQSAEFGQRWAAPLFTLAVLAAPPLEEFIFRGLVFGGLRRSLRVAPAILASAAIFAIVHPPVSWVPVFCLGVAAALAFQRTNRLLAPMLTHAIYNLVVVGAQWLAT